MQDDSVAASSASATTAPASRSDRSSASTRYTTIAQSRPSVAADAVGDFVVVWAARPGRLGLGVFGQRYDSSGIPLARSSRSTPTRRATRAVRPWPRTPPATSSSSGRALPGRLGYGVFGQRYASSGRPRPRVPRQHLYDEHQQAIRPSPPTPPATSSSSGRAAQDGSRYGIFGQRYASSGTPLGPEFRVNTYTTNIQRCSVRGRGYRRQLRRRLG